MCREPGPYTTLRELLLEVSVNERMSEVATAGPYPPAPQHPTSMPFQASRRAALRILERTCGKFAYVLLGSK